MSSDGYDWDPASDDEFAWSGDDLDDAAPAEDPPVINRNGGDSLEIPAALAEFRLNWTAEIIKPHAPRPPRPVANHHPVFANPDLLDIIVAVPQLVESDLKSLALVDTTFWRAAQRRLFRSVTIPTLSHARRFASLLERNPALASFVKHLSVPLADHRIMVLETPEVRRLIDSKRSEEDNEEEAWFYDASGRSVSRMPWMNALYRELGEITSLEVLEAARSRKHTKWALGQLVLPDQPHVWSNGRWLGADAEDDDTSDEEDPERQRRVQEKRDREERIRCKAQVAQELTTAIASWPFDTSADASANEPLLAALFRLPQRLSLSYPLSHYVFPLALILSSSTNLQHLRIVGQEESAGSLPYDEDKFTGGPAILRLQTSGCAFKGAPSSLASVTLDSLYLVVEDGSGDVVVDAETAGRWQPGHVDLWHVLAFWTSPATTTNKRPLALIPRNARHRVLDLPPESFGGLQSNFLCLDLFTFLGQSALTSLVLVDVSGVIPSTIYRAIHASGATLRHLELVDINCRSSAGGAPDDDRGSPAKCVFPLSAPDAPASARSPDWDALDAAAARLAGVPARPVDPEPPHAPPRDFAASPYIPDLVDALLAAAPPLETLRWRVGVPAGREAFGAREWEAFALRVTEIEGATGGALLREESKVWVAVDVVLDGEETPSRCCVS
ncbi:hypothetical protein JCM10449v2_000309 [Rhodotorula kratochvilovae]